MDWIAAALSAILIVIALIHLAWGLGSNWPAKSEQELSNMVVGTKGAKHMPSRPLTLIIAIAIVAAALWPLMWQALIPYPNAFPQTLVWFGMWVLAAVFLVRGFGGFLPMAQDTEQPFKRLNKLYYSPLCVILGVGFLTLVLNP